MYYKVLLDRASKLERTAQDAQNDATKLREQLDSLASSRSELESGLKVTSPRTIVWQLLTAQAVRA